MKTKNKLFLGLLTGALAVFGVASMCNATNVYAAELDRPRVRLLSSGFSPNMDYYFRRPFNFLFTGQIVPALEGDC